MLLTIDQYIEQYKDKLDKYTEPYLRNLSKPTTKSDYITDVFLNQESYMLKWNSEYASIWAGPFEGNFVFCKITDYNYKYPRPKSIQEIKEQEKTYKKYSNFSWPYNYPEKILKRDVNDCLTNVELKLLISNASKSDLEFYNKKLQEEFNWELESESKEFPVRLYMCGNDDCSFSKIFETFEDAKNCLNKLEGENEQQIILNEFRFTN